VSKYDNLAGFLKSQTVERVAMTFSQVENVLGFKLPASAREYPAWWANEHKTHVQARAWLTAGFETESVDLSSRNLVFKRVGGRTMGRGMSEPHRPFSPESDKVARHPAIGALKGMFTIEPGYDIAKSDPEEVAEWEAAIDRKADLYEAGRSRK
jgi:hypothetical protein